jgi:iron complex outermembrane receptor protein
MSPDSAATLADSISSLPVGTVSPDQVGASTDILILTSQGGSYDNWGADLSLEIQLSERFWTSATYSWVLDNTIPDVAVIGDVVLGIPRNKGSVTLGYRNTRSGLNTSIRARAVESFPVMNGVYAGNVEAYAVLDLDLSYRIPVNPAATVSLSASNLFDNRHQEFVGAPELGRLVVGRVKVGF